MRRLLAVLLAAATAGSRGAVVRISDRDPAVLRLLTENAIGLDTVLELADAGVLLPDDSTLALSADALASIWISTEPRA